MKFSIVVISFLLSLLLGKAVDAVEDELGLVVTDVLLSGLDLETPEVVFLGDTTNPCHAGQIKNTISNCKVVTLPSGFCPATVFGDIDDNGNFEDCTRTIQLEPAPDALLDKMNEYIHLNPCDVARKDAFFDFMNSTNDATLETARLKLDHFLYTMCEEACDCIPQELADRDSPSVSIERGNCQSHAYFDTCRIFPDIRLIRSPDSPNDNPNDLPAVCPLLTSWLVNNPAWPEFPITMVENDVRYFLERYLDASDFFGDNINPVHWNQCFNLELTQGRISEL